MRPPVTVAGTPALTVYYDGACPLCRREISYYRRQRGADALAWVDVGDADCALAPGLDRETARARFHVLTSDGRLVSGARAFTRLWAALPQFRLLGRLSGARPQVWLLAGAYLLFLRVRPALQWVLGRRERRNAACRR